MRTTSHPIPPKPGPTIFVHRIDSRAKLPTRANEFAIGLDVYAFLLTESGKATSRAIHQKGVTEVPTGISVRAPEGYYIQTYSRSGLARKGVFVANAPGIIDPDYSGELIILLFNGSFETYYVSHEHRIAQLILTPIIRYDLGEDLAKPSSFGRADIGFGSTGL